MKRMSGRGHRESMVTKAWEDIKSMRGGRRREDKIVADLHQSKRAEYSFVKITVLGLLIIAYFRWHFCYENID